QHHHAVPRVPRDSSRWRSRGLVSPCADQKLLRIRLLLRIPVCRQIEIVLPPRFEETRVDAATVVRQARSCVTVCRDQLTLAQLIERPTRAILFDASSPRSLERMNVWMSLDLE